MLALLTFGAVSSALAQQEKNEIATDVTILSRKPSGDNTQPRVHVTSWEISYARFLAQRLAAGPLFKVTTVTRDRASWYFGGLGRLYFADQDARAIPVVEVNAVRSVHDRFVDHTAIQVLGGVAFPMGKSGGRFRIGPYYTKTFYEHDATGLDSSDSFGFSWNVSLLF
jgi:hypothetical protein